MVERVDLAALIKSLLVHLGIVAMFLFSWSKAEQVVLPKPMPQHVTAMIVEKPKPPAPSKPPPPARKPEPPKPEVKKPEPKKPEPPKPVPKKPEPKKPEPKKPEPKKPEPPKPQPKPPEPQKPEPKTDSTDFSDLLKSEMKQLDTQPRSTPQTSVPAPSSSDKEQDEIQQYLGLLQQTISRYWVRPPSARTGMMVTLRINLMPGGELNDVNVIESSGNAAFDRSAVLAVQKAGRFSVPSDPGKFDRYFRSIRLRFNPEDLRY